MEIRNLRDVLEPIRTIFTDKVNVLLDEYSKVLLMNGMNNDPSDPQTELKPRGWQKFRAGVRRAAPFASGVLAALAAILLYSILFPGQHVLTQNELNNAVAQALASATPPPAFSERVYQVIQPSLILIETHSADGERFGERRHHRRCRRYPHKPARCGKCE